MNLIKKISKEISIFGIVLIVFIGLFTYRYFTFKDFSTINETKLTQMVEEKEDFVVVLGDSTNSTTIAYQDILTQFTTDNRNIPVYFVDKNENNKFDDYVKKTFDINVTYPSTLIIKDGKVVAKKEQPLSYYNLTDFITENY